MAYTDLTDWKKCTLCGECLMKCPVLNMEQQEAATTIKKLIKNETTPKLFKECRYCFNCNNYCPQELRVHELILKRALEHRKKIPRALEYMMNGQHRPTIWSDLYDKLNSEEQEILTRWHQPPPPAKDVLFVGCVGKLSCRDLENSIVLKDVPKFGPKDICCGELAFRLGSWEAYTETIEKTLKIFKSLTIERMICYCGSCYNFFSNVLPKVYGKQVPFQLISMYQWLLEKKENNELHLKQPLNYKATIHESYYVSELGPSFWDPLREICRAAEMDIIDIKHQGYNNLPCGAVSSVDALGFALNPLKEAPGRYREVKEAGTKHMTVHCPGCYIALSSTNSLFGIKLHYLAEELLVAFGDTINVPLKTRIPLITKQVIKRLPGFILG